MGLARFEINGVWDRMQTLLQQVDSGAKSPFSSTRHDTRRRLRVSTSKGGAALCAADARPYFFLVITSFWILKPIKKSLFIQHYDVTGFDLLGCGVMTASQAGLLAKVLNMVVAFLAVVVFTWLVRRFRRQQLTFIFTGFFLVSYAGYALVIHDPAGATVWSFYLFEKRGHACSVTRRTSRRRRRRGARGASCR